MAEHQSTWPPTCNGALLIRTPEVWCNKQLIQQFPWSEHVFFCWQLQGLVSFVLVLSAVSSMCLDELDKISPNRSLENLTSDILRSFKLCLQQVNIKTNWRAKKITTRENTNQSRGYVTEAAQNTKYLYKIKTKELARNEIKENYN